jgi:hypothetical protein
MAQLTAPTAEAASSESRIDSLLGADLGVGTVETAEPAEGDTPLAGEETTDEGEVGEPTEATEDQPETGDEPAEGEASTEDEPEGEEDFNVSDLETDYAESAYTKAAAHFSKQFGKTLNPNDAGDRAILKELMDRGQKIAEAGRQSEEEPEEEETEAAPAAEAAPAKTPQEVMKLRLDGAKAYAKESVVPEIAMDFAQAFVESLWPGKNVKVTQEQATALTQTMTAFGAMLVGDAIPSILGAVPGAVSNRYPMFDKVITMAEREAVVDEVMGAVDAQGNPQFPGIDRLIENGTIKKLVNGEQLKDAVFNKDPFKNMIAKTKMAYKMARGEGFDPKLISTAVNRGKELARERARKVSAGRVPAGSSRSATAGRERSGASFVENLAKAGHSGGAFSRMLKEHGK